MQAVLRGAARHVRRAWRREGRHGNPFCGADFYAARDPGHNQRPSQDSSIYCQGAMPLVVGRESRTVFASLSAGFAPVSRAAIPMAGVAAATGPCAGPGRISAEHDEHTVSIRQQRRRRETLPDDGLRDGPEKQKPHKSSTMWGFLQPSDGEGDAVTRLPHAAAAGLPPGVAVCHCTYRCEEDRCAAHPRFTQEGNALPARPLQRAPSRCTTRCACAVRSAFVFDIAIATPPMSADTPSASSDSL